MLLHMTVDSRMQRFVVVVAGSSGVGGLSGVTEVFDSFTSQWTVTGSLPGPQYALNEFQSGVFLDGNILCIAFIEPEKKGILAYDVEQGRWSSWDVALPTAPILQLVACGGHVFLFSEQVNGRAQFCVDRIQSTHLTEVVRREKPGGARSLESGPECVCVVYAETRLCVFNTVSHTGVIYDVCGGDGDTRTQDFLQAPSGDWSGEMFYVLNPLSFPLQLNLASQVDTRPP